MTIEAPPAAWSRAIEEELKEHVPPGWAMVMLTNPDMRRAVLLLLWTLRPAIVQAEILVPASRDG